MDALGELFSKLVPSIATLIITGIPGLVAVPSTIIYVTFWRHDNRSSGKPPFTFEQITDKIYLWGSLFGIGSAALLQGLVELLLEQTFSWQLRISLAVIAFTVTGRASRIAFDGLRGYAAHKARKGSEIWKRVYDYFTVTHPPLSGRRSADKYAVKPVRKKKT